MILSKPGLKSREQRDADFQKILQRAQRSNTRVKLVSGKDVEVPTYIAKFLTPYQRKSNPLHNVPYYACFKPALPGYFIEHFTDAGDIVYDPFMGRGTTLIEAALRRRVPYGNDSNQLSIFLAQPRLDPPASAEVAVRLETIDFEKRYDYAEFPVKHLVFFHHKTLKQLCTLKKYLLARQEAGTMDRVDEWIWMVTMTRLTGHSKGYCSRYSLPPNLTASDRSQQRINKGAYLLSWEEVVRPIHLAERLISAPADDRVSRYLSKSISTETIEAFAKCRSCSDEETLESNLRSARSALKKLKREEKKLKASEMRANDLDDATRTSKDKQTFRKEIKDSQEGLKNLEQLRKALAKDLNSRIEAGPIFDDEIFAGVELSPKVKKHLGFMNRHPKERRTVLGFLNRWLLLEVYAGDVEHIETLKRRHMATEKPVRQIIIDRTKTLLSGLLEHERDNLNAVRQLALLTTGPADENSKIAENSVSLVVTSPPFLKLVNYKAQTRLRCWFGGINLPDPAISSFKIAEWEVYITKVLVNLYDVVRPGGHVVFEVGELDEGRTKLEISAVRCGDEARFEPLLIMINSHPFTKTYDIVQGQNSNKGTNTNRIVIFRKPLKDKRPDPVASSAHMGCHHAVLSAA